jgi:peptide/nickel transport system substrate-binding protein
MPSEQETLAGPAESSFPLGKAMAPVRPGGRYVHALQRDIPNWNLLHADGNIVETGMVLQNLAPSAFIPCPDLMHRWNQDLLATRPEIVATDPCVIVYHIRPDAVWNDGTPLTAADFIYTYRIQNGVDGPGCKVSTHAGYEQVESVTGSADGKVVAVTFQEGKVFADWEAMFSYIHPAHIAARAGDLSTPDGLAAAFASFNDQPPAWSAGPYQIDRYAPGEEVRLVPNRRWYGRVRPALDTVTLAIVSHPEDLAPALRERRINGMTPQLSPEILAEVAELPGVRCAVSTGWLWEHLDLNTRTPALADPALRRALFTATDRATLIKQTVAPLMPGLQPLNSHCFVPGLPAYQDIVAAAGQGGGDTERARSILAGAGYTLAGGELRDPSGNLVPPLRICYPAGNSVRERTTRLLAGQWARLGLRAHPGATRDLGATLDAGGYDAVLFAWNGNPARIGPARDMYGTGGGMNFGCFSHPGVDQLLQEAAGMLDLTRGHELLNQADKILTESAYTLPLYLRPALLAVDESFANIENNPTNGLVIYNIEYWGLRADHAARRAISQ